MRDRLVVGIDPSFRGFAAAYASEMLCVAATGESLREKCGSLYAALADFLKPFADDPMLWVIEQPMPTERNVMHLYNMGHLMSHLYDLAESLDDVEIHEVHAGRLKIFVCDNGQANKIDMAVGVHERWGIRFEHDSGGNKYDAYALFRFGEAYLRGENPGVRPPKLSKRKKAVVATAPSGLPF